MRSPNSRSLLPLRALALLLVGGIAACSYLGLGDSRKEPRSYRMIYSPNGEPLRGGSLGLPSCEEAMGGWFSRADSNRDGRLDRSEFVADAERQFPIMDINHDGIITPAELDKYRAPYRTVQANNGGSRPGARANTRAQSAGAEPDPVMAADTKLRFIVTREDFMDHAARRFAELDRSRDGLLDRGETTKLLCSDTE